MQVVRGGPGAPLAQLLAALQPAVASAAGLPAWSVVASGPESGIATGRLIVSPALVRYHSSNSDSGGVKGFMKPEKALPSRSSLPMRLGLYSAPSLPPNLPSICDCLI